MGCVSQTKRDHKQGISKSVTSKLNPQQIKALQMIYADIAVRHPYGGIDYENFQLFFQKGGLWSQTIFKQFDINNQNLLSENQFIYGIAKISSQSLVEKAKRLFLHFSSGSKKIEKTGILYKDFLRILYNYPKRYITEILHDQYFFQSKVKTNLIGLQNNPYQTVSRVPENQSVAFRLANQDNQTIPDHQKDQQRLSRTSLQKRRSNQKNLNTSLTFFLYDKKLNIKMTSIHALVKKYAQMIFTDLGLDTKKGQLTQQNFIEWVQNHPNLYKSYYGSFHDYVWRYNGQYRYQSQKPEMISKAYMLENKKTYLTVQMLNVKGMLIIQEPNKKQKLRKIIYLEGLIVTQSGPKQITISHNNAVYTQIIFKFDTSQILSKWMNILSYYKGLSIYKDFILTKKIGAGKFSVVHQGTQISTGKVFAVKQVETYRLTDQVKNVLKHQKDILSQLDHHNFPKFYKAYKSRTHTHIVMQYIQGHDLYECLKKKGKFSEIQAVPIIKQIIEGVKYLQHLDIIHRDLKPDNIVLINNSLIGPKIKIIDFGFSVANYSSKKIKQNENQAVGTANFIAPQVLESTEDDISKCDDFAVGAITYYMLTGNLPFLASGIDQVFQKTKRGEYDKNCLAWKRLSQNAKNFISALLETNPHLRISMKEALKHPWIKDTIIYEASEMSAGLATRQKRSPLYKSQAIIY